MIIKIKVMNILTFFCIECKCSLKNSHPNMFDNSAPIVRQCFCHTLHRVSMHTAQDPYKLPIFWWIVWNIACPINKNHILNFRNRFQFYEGKKCAQKNYTNKLIDLMEYYLIKLKIYQLHSIWIESWRQHFISHATELALWASTYWLERSTEAWQTHKIFQCFKFQDFHLHVNLN